MKLFEIKHHFSGKVLFSFECASRKICVETAIKGGANLAGAYLARADLAGANLAGAYLARAYLARAYLAGANLARADLAGANLAGANLAGAYLAGAYLARADLAGANLAGAYLARADLAGANLAGAYLARAYLGGAQIIDGGQDKRGFRFFAWQNKDGHPIYVAGCHEWDTYAEAIGWYSETYESNGDRHECLARLALMRQCAIARGWIDD